MMCVHTHILNARLTKQSIEYETWDDHKLAIAALARHVSGVGALYQPRDRIAPWVLLMLPLMSDVPRTIPLESDE